MGSPLYSTKPQVTVDFPSDTGLYEVRLTITNDRGCATTDALNIRVRPGLQFYVPTVFTPDGKGPQANEVFKVVMDSTASYQLTVRNKWGEFVFKSNNPEECWNGRFMGQAAPAGVYIWDVEATTIYGNYVRKSGSVMLLR
jgi:gliding motility-associated-like protein